MPKPTVSLRRKNPDGTTRHYAVDGVIEGTSGFVVTDKSDGGAWGNVAFHEAATPSIQVSPEDQERCVVAVTVHLAAQPPGYDEPGPPITSRHQVSTAKG